VHSISGYIQDNQLNGIDNVVVTLSGDADQTITTVGGNGYYEFNNLTPGNYTVTPSITGYSFTPANNGYNPLDADQTNQNFTGTLIVYSISGYIQDSSSGDMCVGVTVALSGDESATTTTSGTGYYEFTNLTMGNYTVTPSKAGCTFTPPNSSYIPLQTDQTNQNFTGSVITVNVYVIRGYIRDSESMGINCVTITLSGDADRTHTTGSDGYYEFIDLSEGNYTTTPDKSGYTFSPQNMDYALLNSDQTSQNFTGTSIIYSISGYIRDSGSTGIGNVTVTLSGALSRTFATISNGYYEFNDLSAGDYTVTPDKAGYTFSPQNSSYDQ